MGGGKREGARRPHASTARPAPARAPPARATPRNSLERLPHHPTPPLSPSDLESARALARRVVARVEQRLRRGVRAHPGRAPAGEDRVPALGWRAARAFVKDRVARADAQGVGQVLGPAVNQGRAGGGSRWGSGGGGGGGGRGRVGVGCAIRRHAGALGRGLVARRVSAMLLGGTGAAAGHRGRR